MPGRLTVAFASLGDGCPLLSRLDDRRIVVLQRAVALHLEIGARVRTVDQNEHAIELRAFAEGLLGDVHPAEVRADAALDQPGARAVFAEGPAAVFTFIGPELEAAVGVL